LVIESITSSQLALIASVNIIYANTANKTER